MAETIMHTAAGELSLRRPHTPGSSPLRAWSAADQLVLDHLLAGDELGRVLIVNDEFGALTCALASHDPVVWTDSALSRSAIGDNLRANGLAPLASAQIVPGHEVPDGEFDTILVRVPKTTALLEYQLGWLATRAALGGKVIGVGMVRHIHSSTVQLFERMIGTTTTSRATRKARLIHSQPRPRAVAPTADQGNIEFRTPSGLRIAERPGTFSAGHLDVGSSLLLDMLAGQPEPPAGAVVADLGCGNGVLAAELAARWSHAQFVLLDASDLAVAAATTTWLLNNLGSRMRAEAADGFSTTANASIDLVVSNPPFHQGHALDPDLTDRLMADTARVLRPGGVAYMVAQRHLNMHTRLRQWFKSVEVLSKHPSHVALKVS